MARIMGPGDGQPKGRTRGTVNNVAGNRKRPARRETCRDRADMAGNAAIRRLLGCSGAMRRIPQEPTMYVRIASSAPLVALLCGAAITTLVLALQPRQDTAAAATTPAADGATQAGPDGTPAPNGIHATTTASAPVIRGESRLDTLDPAEGRARIDANIAALERRFATEPLDLAWADREERALQTFFAADALAAQGLPAPDRLQTVCRSATCRISARVSDPVEAETITQRLAMHVAPRLPYGAVMPYPLADGRIQVEAWYSATRIAL